MAGLSKILIAVFRLFDDPAYIRTRCLSNTRIALLLKQSVRFVFLHAKISLSTLLWDRKCPTSQHLIQGVRLKKERPHSDIHCSLGTNDAFRSSVLRSGIKNLWFEKPLFVWVLYIYIYISIIWRRIPCNLNCQLGKYVLGSSWHSVNSQIPCCHQAWMSICWNQNILKNHLRNHVTRKATIITWKDKGTSFQLNVRINQKYKQNLRFPPPCSWDFRSSGLLGSIGF